MAGIYTPSVSFFPNGIFTISSNSATPYFVTQNSMGSYLYGITYIYLQSALTQQILQGLNFRSYDVNGDVKSFINTTIIDPYQFQNSLFVKPIRVVNSTVGLNQLYYDPSTGEIVYYQP